MSDLPNALQQFIDISMLPDFESAPDPGELAACATAFLEWNDLAPDARGQSEAYSRSVGMKRAASYIQALAKAARDGDSVTRANLEPARRIALALFDAGSGFPNPIFRHEETTHYLAEKLWGGRKAPSRLIMEGRAVGCLWFLVEKSPKVSTRRSASHVAKLFAMLGHTGRKGGDLTGSTVRKWFDEMVAITGQKAVDHPRAGLESPVSSADYIRQHEAIRTLNVLLRRHANEPEFNWFNYEVYRLAADCSVTASTSALRVSRYGGM